MTLTDLPAHVELVVRLEMAARMTDRQSERMAMSGSIRVARLAGM